MEKYLPENTELHRKEKPDGKHRKMTRAAGWVLLAAAVLFVVPVGCIMFMISGLWSAADKVLSRIGR